MGTDRPAWAVGLSLGYLAAVLATWLILNQVSDRLDEARWQVVQGQIAWLQHPQAPLPDLAASPVLQALGRFDPATARLLAPVTGSRLADLEAAVAQSSVKMAAAIRIASLMCALAVVLLMGVIVYQVRSLAEARRSARAHERHLHDLLQAQDQERQRIGLELHDTLAQELSSVRMQLGLLAEDQAGTRERLRGLLAGAVERVRTLSWTLSPPELGRFGVRGALSHQLSQRRPSSGRPQLKLVDDGSPEPSWGTRGVQVYRVVQEALSNALAHAEAGTIEVRLGREGDSYLVEVVDDGKGFDPAQGAPEGHLGLFSMQERARMIGARWSVRSSPGQGTTVRLEVSNAP